MATVSEMVARIMRSNTSVGFKSDIYSGNTRIGEARSECRGVNQESRVKAYQEAQEQTQTDLSRSRSRSPRFSTRYLYYSNLQRSRRGYRHVKVVLRIASVTSRITALTFAHGD